MNQPHPTNTLKWLIIEGDDARKVFVFRATDDHTIVVGSAEGVHYRVSDAAPLCFYVEREGQQLFLVPAYVGHLRLNSHRVAERTLLPASGIVEFGRNRLKLNVQEVPPHEDDVTVMLPFDPPQGKPDETAHYDEAMATRIAEYEPASDENDAPTAMLSAPGSPVAADVTDAMEFARTEEEAIPHSLRRPAAEPQEAPPHAPLLDDDDPALATQIMGSVPDFDDEYPNYAESAPVRVGPDDPTPADGSSATYQPKQAPKVALSSPKTGEPTPTRLDTGADRTEGIPFDDFVPPTGKSKAVPAPRSEPKPVRDETAPPVSPPEEPTDKPPALPSAFAPLVHRMEQFGTWAKEKPVLAMGGGIAVALMIGLSIGGVSKLLSSPDTAEQAASNTAAPSPPEEAPQEAQVEEPKNAQAAETEVMEPPAEKRKMTPEEEKAEAEARAAEEKAYADDVNRAVEHLVAGRDDEAAHAYQSVAQTKYATEQLKRMSELLKRRSQARHGKKPATHQVPELYR